MADISAAQLRAMQLKTGKDLTELSIDDFRNTNAAPPCIEHIQAKAIRLHHRDGLVARNGRKINKTEARWYDRIAADGEHLAIDFDSVNFCLGPDLHYRPDFFTVRLDGEIWIYEVKGAYIRDDARVKLRAARNAFPHFRWFQCQWAKGEWTVIEL